MIDRRWFGARRSWNVLKDATSVLGLFAMFVSLIQFFPSILSHLEFLQRATSLLFVFLIALAFALMKNRPRKYFNFKLNNRDVEIVLWIGDIADLPYSLVVPVNTEFDMDLNGSVATATSVKSMVIRKYFGGDHNNLRRMLQKELRGMIYTSQKDGDRYKIGTTVMVEAKDKSRRFYFVANSHKQNQRRVRADAADFYTVLNCLWSFISTHGAKEDIAIPLLGTGNGRLSLTREEVCKEIVRSFITSCAEGIYCSRLAIVIRSEDIMKCNINIENLIEFIKLQTQYADFSERDTRRIGEPVVDVSRSPVA